MTALLCLDALVLLAAPAAFFWCCCDAAAGHPLPGCPCALVPDALFYHVDPEPMHTGHNILFPAALAYGARPSDLSVYASDLVGWYSAKFTSDDSLGTYRYWFHCEQGTYALDGLYTPDSPLGYPGSFNVGGWNINLTTNVCSPFSLTVPDPTGRHARVDATGPP